MNPFANEVEAYLKDAGLSLLALSELSGVPRSTLYGIVRESPVRKYPVPAHVVDKIAAVVPEGWAQRIKEAAAATGRSRLPERIKRGTPLQLLVADKLERKKLSYEDVARLSGGLISKATVYMIAVGRVSKPRDQAVKGLARGLGVPEKDVREAVAETLKGTVYELPPQAQTLSAEGWKQVRGFIDYLLESERQRDV